MCAEIIFNLDSNFGWGALPPQTSRILAGEAKTSFLTGLAGGLPPPGPPAFFFATDDTRAARTSGRTSGRTPARPSRKKYLDVPVTIPNTILRFLFFLKANS